ncbi:MAG TPA: hypothetical protein VMJ70_07015 [Candidatus Sulfotelmatobacter sp.]|nr:hypothetical protein [Candidatus Sulfotelmatobacter sp.]
MTRARFPRAFVAVALTIALLPWSLPALAAPVVLDSSWVVAPFATIPASSPEGVSVDGMGRVYVCAGTAGIFRFDTSGTGAPWSSAPGNGQATTPDGRTYVPSRDALFPNHYIWDVAPDGSYSALVSTSPEDGWVWAAVSPSGKLYSILPGGIGEGIYSVDVMSGATTPLFTGGPGAGGAGNYRAIATSGEAVVVSGNDEVGFGIFQLANSTMALVARTPQGMLGICAGPDAIYAASSNVAEGQVWKITPGSATLFAHGFGNTVSVAYDAARNRIYVQDTSPPKLWVISRNPTATRAVTIGRIHQLYR